MRYYIIDALTSQPFGGNPAGVVLLDGDTFPAEELMLQVAADSDSEEIYRAIGVTDYQPTLPVQIAYSGLPDIMIPIFKAKPWDGLRWSPRESVETV